MKRDTNAIETAARHVVPGHRIVSRQRQIADHLIAQGHDASDVQYTLDLFIRTLAIFEEHLRELGAAHGYAQSSGATGPREKRTGGLLGGCTSGKPC